MAELFLASERQADGTRAPVAVKRIRPEAASDPKVVKMLIDEGRVTQLLTHPGIARTLRTLEADGQFFLVMEYVDGRDLRTVLKKLVELGKRLPHALAALIALRAVEALDHAHRAATESGQHLMIVHRDINPTNLMVSYAGLVRVVDFGIARAADRLTTTQAGVVKGKLRYMAPEQAGGKQLDHRADLFAVGLVLCELLSGRKPLPELSDMEFIHRVMRGTVPPLRERHPEIPAALDAIVERAMQPDREKRYGWGSEMASELEGWLASLPRPPREPDLGAVMSRIFPGEAAKTQQTLVELSE
jgi:eukaryotic-like serine/threonine-protein kinase